MYTTALEEGELIKAVRFPVPRKAAYIKFKQPASRFALVGVFVAQTAQGVRVAVTGAGLSVFRHAGLEAALNQSHGRCGGCGAYRRQRAQQRSARECALPGAADQRPDAAGGGSTALSLSGLAAFPLASREGQQPRCGAALACCLVLVF
jgi:hypothetical protein